MTDTQPAAVPDHLRPFLALTASQADLLVAAADAGYALIGDHISPPLRAELRQALLMLTARRPAE